MNLDGFEEIGLGELAGRIGRDNPVAAVVEDNGLALLMDSGARAFIRPRMTEAAGTLGALAAFWKDAPPAFFDDPANYADGRKRARPSHPGDIR